MAEPTSITLADEIRENMYPEEFNLSIQDRMYRWLAEGGASGGGGGGGGEVTAPVTLTSTAVGMIPLTTKGMAGQTGNLLETRDSTNAVHVAIGAGDKRVYGNGQLLLGVAPGGSPLVNIIPGEVVIGAWGCLKEMDGSGTWPSVRAIAGDVTNVALAVQGKASQTGDLLQMRDSADAVMSSVDKAGGWIQKINAQTGTTYTPVAADSGRLVTMNNAGASTFTVPQDSAAAITIGAYIDVMQLGAGQVTVVQGTGATLRNLRCHSEGSRTVQSARRSEDRC